jgi:hypothetical protein
LPERDVVHAFPRVLGRSLAAFDTFKGDDTISLEDLGEACQDLGRLVDGIRQGKVKHKQEVVGKLWEINQHAIDKIGRAFFFAFMGELLQWCADAGPKAEDDKPLDWSEFTDCLESFARNSGVSNSHEDDSDPS